MEVKAGQRARIRKGLIQGRGFGNLKEGVTVVGRENGQAHTGWIDRSTPLHSITEFYNRPGSRPSTCSSP